MSSSVDAAVRTPRVAPVPAGHVHVRHLGAPEGSACAAAVRPAYTQPPVRQASTEDRRRERTEPAPAPRTIHESVLR